MSRALGTAANSYKLETLMTDRPIILRAAFLAAIRAGRRSHIFMPGTFVPGVRTGQAPDPRKGTLMRLPTPWAKLHPGDRLWVQEEIAHLVDQRTPSFERENGSKAFYRVELPGGHVPIPGGARRERWATRNVEARKMVREDSRFTLAVTAVRLCRAHEITWEEMGREGTADPHGTLGSWWGYQYGILMPWPENPAVVGLDFTFIDANIDTGQRWVPEAKPSPPRHEYLFGTRPATDG